MQHSVQLMSLPRGPSRASSSNKILTGTHNLMINLVPTTYSSTSTSTNRPQLCSLLVLTHPPVASWLFEIWRDINHRPSTGIVDQSRNHLSSTQHNQKCKRQSCNYGHTRAITISGIDEYNYADSQIDGGCTGRSSPCGQNAISAPKSLMKSQFTCRAH